MRAHLNIKTEPHYRRDAFEKGLRKHGYEIVDATIKLGEGDLFLSWNLHGSNEIAANHAAKQRGARVMVAENGPIGEDSQGRQLYSIALDGHHNGRWHVGDVSRWEALGIPVKPWREDGEVLVLGQRGIGARAMASPPAWDAITAKSLQARGLPVRVRPHPGWLRKSIPLMDDLKGVGRVAVWSSMGGVRALVEGIPVGYYAPAWVAAMGARQGERGVVDPLRCDDARMKALTAVAWYQWRVEEIEQGIPFDCLLRLA